MLLTNLEFVDCRLDSTSSSRAIIEAEECLSDEHSGSVRLHHVSFRRNILEASVALLVPVPACSSLEMVDVDFTKNRCFGDFCGASLSANNTLQSVTLKGNTQTVDRGTTSALLYAPPGSATVVEDIAASENSGCCFLIQEGSLVLTDGSFFQNDATSTGSSACLHAISSNVSVDSCQFEENRARSGAALFGTNSSVRLANSVLEKNNGSEGGAVHLSTGSAVDMKECIFSLNHAMQNGGGIWAESSTIVGDSVVFDNNTAGANGAGFYCEEQSVVVMSNCEFSLNRAPFGGATEFETKSAGLLRDCSFSENSATRSGGVSYVEASTLIAVRCTFASNDATFGASLYCTSSTLAVNSSSFQGGRASETGGSIHAEVNSSVSVLNTTFVENDAEFYGGAVYLESTNVQVSGSIFESNSAGTTGGGLYARRSDVRLSESGFSDNRARWGAATGFENATCNLEACVFMNNSAERSGGASYIEEVSRVNIDGSTFSGNSATFGGALYCQVSTLTVDNSVFERGRATETGGCIHSRRRSRVTILNTTMLENQAEDRGGAVFATQSSSFLCSDCHFEKNRARNFGGAASLVSQESQLLTFQFDHCIIANNSADFGGRLVSENRDIPEYVFAGGIHFRSEDGTTDCARPNANCMSLAVVATDIANNQAMSSGGGIYAGEPKAVRFSCQHLRKRDPISYFTRRQLGSMKTLRSLGALCPEWKGNSADVSGHAIASGAASVKKWIYDKRENRLIEIKGNRHTVRNHRSSDPLPLIQIEVLDEFGQGPVVAVDDEVVVATMSSDDLLFCSLETRMPKGTGNFTGVVLFKPPGDYRVRIDFNSDSVPSLELVIQIPSCTLNQFVSENGDVCQNCGDSMYNLQPEERHPGCIPCPENGRCDGKAIRPRNGYWHQTPCSAHIQRCLTRDACNEPERDASLYRMSESLENCSFDEQYIKRYMQIQCRKVGLPRRPVCRRQIAFYPGVLRRTVWLM